MGLYNLLSGVLPLGTQLDTGRVWPIYFPHKMFFLHNFTVSFSFDGQARL